MGQYLLSTFAVEGEVPGAPKPEEMQAFMQRVMALEAEMDEAGVFAFGGALFDANESTVLQPGDGEVASADGPYVDATAQLAGFYIINAEDQDAALAWANKVVEAINHPIEVRPFRATGKMADHMPGA